MCYLDIELGVKYASVVFKICAYRYIFGDKVNSIRMVASTSNDLKLTVVIDVSVDLLESKR